MLAKDRYLVVNREVDRMIVLSDPGIDDFRNELLWSPERPTLLDAKVRLLKNGEVIDEFESYTALRSVHILRDRFMLNSRPTCCGWCSIKATGPIHCWQRRAMTH